MNRALRSFQPPGAQQTGSHLIAALTVYEGSPRKVSCSTCLLPDDSFWTNVFSQKCSVTGAEMFQHLLIFIGDLPKRFLRSWLWPCHCRLGLEGARKTVSERKTWTCRAVREHFHKDVKPHSALYSSIEPEHILKSKKLLWTELLLSGYLYLLIILCGDTT